MIINVFGFYINVLAIIVFMFSTLLVTEIIKYYIKREVLERHQYLIPLGLSWVVGIICFRVVFLFTHQPIDINATLQFALFTLLLNGGYQILKPIIRIWLLSKGIDIDKKFEDHQKPVEEVKIPTNDIKEP